MCIQTVINITQRFWRHIKYPLPVLPRMQVHSVEKLVICVNSAKQRRVSWLNNVNENVQLEEHAAWKFFEA